MSGDQYIRSEKARQVLRETDFVVIRAMEAALMSPEWCAWRDVVRRIAETGKGEIPGEPNRTRIGAKAPDPAEPPEHLAEFFSRLESAEQADARLAGEYSRAKSMEEYHRSHNDMHEAMQWLRKAERIESAIRWNRPRLVDKL